MNLLLVFILFLGSGINANQERNLNAGEVIYEELVPLTVTPSTSSSASKVESSSTSSSASASATKPVYEELVPLTVTPSTSSSASKVESSSSSSSSPRNDRFKYKSGRSSHSHSHNSRSTSSPTNEDYEFEIPLVPPVPPAYLDIVTPSTHKTSHGALLDEAEPLPTPLPDTTEPSSTEAEITQPPTLFATELPSRAPTSLRTSATTLANVVKTAPIESENATFSGTTLIFVVGGLLLGFYLWSRQSNGTKTNSTTTAMKYSQVPTRESEIKVQSNHNKLAMDPIEDEFGEDFESDFDIEDGRKTVELPSTKMSGSIPYSKNNSSQYKPPEDEWRDELSDSHPDKEDGGWTSEENHEVVPLSPKSTNFNIPVLPPPPPTTTHIPPKSTLPAVSATKSNLPKSQPQSQSSSQDDIFASIGMEAAPTFKKAVVVANTSKSQSTNPNTRTSASSPTVQSLLKDVNLLDDAVNGGNWGDDDCDISD